MQCLPGLNQKCVNENGFCGACVDNCGNTLQQVCAMYGIPNATSKTCGLSSRLGNTCAGTLVCCHIDYPYGYTAANGKC